ncbi:hypothetical protein SS50377_24947 [Spironucleus salmonicida]|uniref:Uncharacterized protein n=1 Tax=Spironucleus salmonicida TaxID=348837 RepID=A0A9P8LRJ9_9EUKA|nr:hypothetical protein SS50377_24947 [Spironucleus salmonicida]
MSQQVQLPDLEFYNIKLKDSSFLYISRPPSQPNSQNIKLRAHTQHGASAKCASPARMLLMQYKKMVRPIPIGRKMPWE